MWTNELGKAVFPPSHKKRAKLYACPCSHKPIVSLIRCSLEMFYFERSVVTHNRRKRTAKRYYENLP